METCTCTYEWNHRWTDRSWRSYLDEFLLEYDGGDSDNNRKLFLTENDAKNASATEFATIVDYNETITPVIGLAKPSNVTLIEKGSGFNSDIDVVVSKGRQSNGSAVYNTTFGLSYFDPQFFTKLSLDEPITVTGSFSNGQYVYGLQSGAYGVIEGATDTAYVAIYATEGSRAAEYGPYATEYATCAAEYIPCAAEYNP